MSSDPARILLINGHPDPSPDRLCAALSDAYARGAVAAGHQLRRTDLGRIDVPLLQSQAEFDAPPPTHLIGLQEDLTWATHLVMVFPLWLGGAPAKLKALLEQLMRGGYGFDQSPRGPTGKLKGRSARLVVTMGMPGAVYDLYFGAQGVLSLERGVLRLVGMKPVKHTFIGGVAGAAPARRRKWLARLETLGSSAG